MNLYVGKILVVDLTTKEISTEPLCQEWVKEYWGAWGLALRYYWDLVEPEVDPLSADNAVVIMDRSFFRDVGSVNFPSQSGFQIASHWNNLHQ